MLVRWKPLTKREKQTIKENGKWWFVDDEKFLADRMLIKAGNDLRWIHTSQVLERKES